MNPSHEASRHPGIRGEKTCIGGNNLDGTFKLRRRKTYKPPRFDVHILPIEWGTTCATRPAFFGLHEIVANFRQHLE